MGKVKNMKVAFFHPDLGIGGAERLILDIAIALTQQGMDVLFVTNHFDKNHAFEELKSEKYPVMVIGDWIPRSIFGYCQALCAYIRMMYLSIIYVLFLRHFDQSDVYVVDQIPMAVPFLKLSKQKVIYYCHHPDLLASSHSGSLKRLYRAPIDYLELKGTKMADEILVNSRYTAQIFKKTFPEIKKELKIVYPTISSAYQSSIKRTARKPMKSLIAELSAVRSDTFFLSINRYHPAKRLELAIDALDSFRSKTSPENFDKIHLIIAGGYDPNSTINKVYFDELTKLTTEKNLDSKITFLKSPSDELKADLLVSCDCLMYTPVNEHFGIVPLEAMAASRPVLACNSGGPRETVEDGVTGFLCKPDGASFADAMLKLLDKGRIDEMGLKGNKRLKKLFTYDTFSKAVSDIVSNAYCTRN